VLERVQSPGVVFHVDRVEFGASVLEAVFA
jgi:hypothetical protein